MRGDQAQKESGATTANRDNYYKSGAQQCELETKLLFKSFGKTSDKNSGLESPCYKTLGL